jgi:hypothetical protein
MKAPSAIKVQEEQIKREEESVPENKESLLGRQLIELNDKSYQ